MAKKPKWLKAPLDTTAFMDLYRKLRDEQREKKADKENKDEPTKRNHQP